MDTVVFIFTRALLPPCASRLVAVSLFHAFCMAASNYRVVCNLHAITVYNARARALNSLRGRSLAPDRPLLSVPLRASVVICPVTERGYAISARFVAHPAMDAISLLARLIISTRKLSRIHRRRGRVCELVRHRAVIHCLGEKCLR